MVSGLLKMTYEKYSYKPKHANVQCTRITEENWLFIKKKKKKYTSFSA